MMNVPPDMLMKDLLSTFCSRRGLNPEHYILRLPTSEAQLPRDVTVLSLGANQVVVQPLQSAPPHDFSVPAEPPSTEQVEEVQPLILSELAAGAYKEFHVVKTNKYGVMQERIMGIDHDYVHNKLPSGISGFLGAKKTKKESRAIADITRLAPLADRPHCLMIEFKEGSDRVAYTYQCRNRVDANEIVARLKFLMAVQRTRSASGDAKASLL